jgi:hypothetical protein
MPVLEQYMSDLEEMKEVSITDFILAMQRYGAFGQDRQSKLIPAYDTFCFLFSSTHDTQLIDPGAPQDAILYTMRHRIQ